MTIKEIKDSDKVLLLASDICDILGCDAHAIRVAANKRPDLLGFPVCIVGTRVKIPRKPFLAFIGEAAIE